MPNFLPRFGLGAEGVTLIQLNYDDLLEDSVAAEYSSYTSDSALVIPAMSSTNVSNTNQGTLRHSPDSIDSILSEDLMRPLSANITNSAFVEEFPPLSSDNNNSEDSSYGEPLDGHMLSRMDGYSDRSLTSNVIEEGIFQVDGEVGYLSTRIGVRTSMRRLYTRMRQHHLHRPHRNNSYQGAHRGDSYRFFSPYDGVMPVSAIDTDGTVYGTAVDMDDAFDFSTDSRSDYRVSISSLAPRVIPIRRDDSISRRYAIRNQTIILGSQLRRSAPLRGDPPDLSSYFSGSRSVEDVTRPTEQPLRELSRSEPSSRQPWAEQQNYNIEYQPLSSFLVYSSPDSASLFLDDGNSQDESTSPSEYELMTSSSSSPIMLSVFGSPGVLAHLSLASYMIDNLQEGANFGDMMGFLD